MNAVNHAEYMDRAMNAEARPVPPYLVRKEVDRLGNTVKAKIVQSYTAGVAEGWRQSRGWLVRNTATLIAFGVCAGVLLAVLVMPMLACWGFA